MVTTIKITCDGVFIQSNSYLANGGGLHHQHSRQQSSSSEPGGHSSGSNSSSLSRGGFGGPGSDNGSTTSSSGGGGEHEDHQMNRGFTHVGKVVDRDGNNNRGLDPRAVLSDSNNNFQKIARRRYQSEEVLTRLQKFSGGSDGSDTVDAAGGPIYYNSGTESDDQFTISFLNTRGHNNGKSLLNQKFIVYNSKKPKPSSLLVQNGYHPSQYRQFLNGRLKPAYSTSVLTSPTLIAASASGSSGRPATATPPPNGLTIAKSNLYLHRSASPAPYSSLSSLSPSSGFASASPTPPASLPTAAAPSNLGQ